MHDHDQRTDNEPIWANEDPSDVHFATTKGLSDRNQTHRYRHRKDIAQISRVRVHANKGPPNKSVDQPEWFGS
jgi:hypothetical protein